MSDIITCIIVEFQTRVEAITPEIAKDIEKAIRAQWGGEHAYIAKRCALVETKRQTINNELRAGRSIAQIEQQHDIPRRTIYRLINHKTRA